MRWLSVVILWLIETYGVHAAKTVTSSSAGVPATGCQMLTFSQLERRLRDEGSFDRRYLAVDLDSAADHFVDLTSTKFLQTAEAETCNHECALRTTQVRAVFEKYGQIPKMLVGSNPVPLMSSGPSFADVRQAFEQRLVPPVVVEPKWSAPLFPNFGTGVLPSKNDNSKFDPTAAPGALETFPPIAADSGWLIGPPTLVAPPAPTNINSSATEDYDDAPARRPRWRNRRPKIPAAATVASDSDTFPTDGFVRRRGKRQSVSSTSLGDSYRVHCSKKGDELESGLHVLCGACRIIRELPREYFPRFVNEVSCSGQTCFDKSSDGGGKCAEQFISLDVLKNVGTADCQKWVPYTIAVPVCCTCLMSDALAQYLKMPWYGETLTTSGPRR